MTSADAPAMSARTSVDAAADLVVAIDGPSGAGKGAVGRALAGHYAMAYLDTGKLYRSLAKRCLEAGLGAEDVEAIRAHARAVTVEDTHDATLMADHISRATSLYAPIPAVRAVLLAVQHDFIADARARGCGAILDGRDIGTVVCPDAPVKLFITAAPEERARRRAAELRALGHDVDEASLAHAIAERDRRDAERAVSPMRPAPDAILLDTTGMSIDAAVDAARRVIDAARVQARPGQS